MRTYAVIGLGSFGLHVAKGLILEHVSLICIDKRSEAIKEVQDDIDDAFVLDCTDKNALVEAGISQADIVIVSIGENLESNILTIMALKEIGIKEIIIKAINNVHGDIFAKLGAHRIVYPQRDAAKSIVRTIVQHPHCVLFDITNTIKVARLTVHENMNNMTLADLCSEFEIHVIAIKQNNIWDETPYDKTIIHDGDTIIITGNYQTIKIIMNKYFI